MTPRNINVTLICRVCGALFNPWIGREETSVVCSIRCNGPYQREQHQLSISKKFYSRVHKTKDCWLWTGSKNSFGYGLITIDGKMARAHRVSYELHNGKIDKGAYVCHSCDNPGCVNPDHLWLGSHSDNMLDMQFKGRKDNTSRMKGIKHPLSKITDADVIEIRRCGGVAKDVAARFGVSKTLIARIRRREVWTHVIDH